jgi:hypothetical protein
MKESYKEFKNECLSNKLRIIQSIENQLIEGKLGSESVLFTDFIYNTHELLGIEPPKNAQYEALKTDRVQEQLNEVLSYINQGYTITNAISKVGLYGTAFYKSLNDDQARQLQSAKNRYKKINNN